MKNFVKRTFAFLCLVIVIAFGYFAVGYIDSRRLVNIVLTYQLDASYHINRFDKINQAKTMAALEKALALTLEHFDASESAFNDALILTPDARAAKKDYQDGIRQLKTIQTALKNSPPHQAQPLEKHKAELKKAEQTLLNARERLFTIAERYFMSHHLKMG